MEGERKPVDLVFVVGPTHSKSKRAISRYIRRVSQSSNGFKVASIHFKPNYDSNLGNNVFLSRIIDFTESTSFPKISELPQVQGNPLQHVTKLSFRDDAVKICFLMTNTLPFNDSYHGDSAQQENNENNDQATEKSSSKVKVYHEDPLLTCRRLAAMGVTIYCIDERNYCPTFCKDMYAAFTYITAGQLILLDKITSLHKILRNIIMEEISMEKQVGQVRDYLCVAWHSWGRKKARVPESLEVLTDNILNHFNNTNIMTHEVLVGGIAPEKPSKLAKEIAKTSEVSEARSISTSQATWSAELNWIGEEHDEVIPGYNDPPPKNEITDVSVSELKLVTRNQVSRMLMRVLTRRPQKQFSEDPPTYTSNRNKENQPEDNKQCNNSVFTPPSDQIMDNNSKKKLLEETVLKTKDGCIPHETIVLDCQKFTLCSVA